VQDRTIWAVLAMLIGPIAAIAALLELLAFIERSQA
jgi:hypothetical protein